MKDTVKILPVGVVWLVLLAGLLEVGSSLPWKDYPSIEHSVESEGKNTRCTGHVWKHMKQSPSYPIGTTVFNKNTFAQNKDKFLKQAAPSQDQSTYVVTVFESYKGYIKTNKGYEEKTFSSTCWIVKRYYGSYDDCKGHIVKTAYPIAPGLNCIEDNPQQFEATQEEEADSQL